MKENNKPTRTEVVIAALLILAIITLFAGCRSKREVVHQDYSHTEAIAVVRDTSFVQSIKVDSTLYTLQVDRVTTYRPDGTREREEVHEKHREQKAVKNSDVANNATTAIDSSIRGNRTVDNSTEVDATPAVKTSRNWAWIVWGVVILTCIIATWLLYAKYKRVGRVL